MSHSWSVFLIMMSKKSLYSWLISLHLSLYNLISISVFHGHCLILSGTIQSPWKQELCFWSTDTFLEIRIPDTWKTPANYLLSRWRNEVLALWRLSWQPFPKVDTLAFLNTLQLSALPHPLCFVIQCCLFLWLCSTAELFAFWLYQAAIISAGLWWLFHIWFPQPKL
jgi:hypothetical protein